MGPGGLTMTNPTLKFFRLRRAVYLLKNTSVSCTFWEPDPQPIVNEGSLRVNGDTRAYLVQNIEAGDNWGDHRYVRSNMMTTPLKFTIDLSNVDCGCLACVYLVAMRDPSAGSSNYCDMAENVAPGWQGGMCTEVDILEANNHAMQTAIHTETGGSFGSGVRPLRPKRLL